jgi:dethiobiotin synthetase
VSVVFVSGTDTGVGKTVATAVLACAARLAGIDVVVCKPVQTGTTGGDDDLAEVARLSGVDRVVGAWRYPEPLAPAAAAGLARLPLPNRIELDVLVRTVDHSNQLTLIEGVGGLLVELGEGGVTLRDLAHDAHAPVLVVVSSGLGTLNQTALTLEALDTHSVSCAGLMIGSWPTTPGRAELSNREKLAKMAELRAVLPAGAAKLTEAEFEKLSASAVDRDWLADLGG